MFEIKEKPKMVARALLVGVYDEPDQKEHAASLLRELEELVNTLGVPVLDRMLLYCREIQARLYIGSGKAEEIHQIVLDQKLDVIIFDNVLSPAQQRNWEQLTGVAVIDRQEVILDIFGQRAHTREARLQVDLARLQYSLPRLTRAWSHFGHQGGGIGGKGEGESQLEQDKRLIRKQIERLKGELKEVKQRRSTQRKERKRTPVPNAAIVGYTNAGKSSLLKRLTDADVLVEDKLFATLDTTTRKIVLPNKQLLLLTDTVGFVRNLPHGLVEAFNATLEESVMADFLIHLLDASQPEVYEHHQATMKVLKELGADEKRTLTVFNKIDKVADPVELSALKVHFPNAHFISVHNGQGLEELQYKLAELLADQLTQLSLVVPNHCSEVIARLHRDGKVIDTHYEGDNVMLEVLLSARLQTQYQSYRAGAPGNAVAAVS